MKSLSHRYKVMSWSSQSPTHKAEFIENKNPNTFWKTAAPCEEARFEIGFAPLKIHAIEVVTSFTPQIEIEAYNKNSFGEGDEIVLYASKTELMSQQSFLKDTETLRVKKLKPLDEEIMKDKTFTFLRVYLFNPYHKQKPVHLGLTSFIIYGAPANLENMLTKSIRDDFENSSYPRNEHLDNFGESKHDNHTSFITQFAAQKRNAQNLEEGSAYSRENFNEHTNGFENFESFTYTKKVRSNNTSKPPSTNKGQNNQIVDLTESLEKTDNAYFNTKLENPREDIKQENSMQIEGQDELDDETKKAMEESKKYFAMEALQRNQENDLNKSNMILETDFESKKQENYEEVEPTQYNKILDQYAGGEDDDISAASLEQLYNEASNRIEKDDDNLTEPLESMQGDDDYQAAFELENMEEIQTKIENPTEISTRKDSKVETAYQRPIKEYSNQSNNKYWEYNKNHGYGGQMFKLTANELSQEYIKNELRVRQETEKGLGVKVTMSLGELLKDVVFSLSGFQNPDRQILKDKAISMGARFRDDLYDGTTTHLICHSKNNGKYEMAKKFKNKIFIVGQDWVETCHSQRKRVDEKYIFVLSPLN